jgi:hypothetical protein
VAYQFLMKKGNIFFISLNIYMLSTRCAWKKCQIL